MLSYEGDATDITTDYFSEVKLGGAAEALTQCLGYEDFYQAREMKATKSDFRQLLPTTNSWIMTFRSSADPSRNKSHTIPSTYVNQILDWLDEH